MLLIPAIDLKDGQCVRLQQGEMDRVTVFANKPEEMAKQIKEETEKFARLVKDGKITLE